MRRLLADNIFRRHGRSAGHLAIESHPRSPEVYARLNIPRFRVAEEGTCLTEGTRIVKSPPR